MQWYANWIAPPEPFGRVCPVYRKTLRADKPVASAKLFLTAAGVYEARLDEKQIGDRVLAPGWTSYRTRLQYQCYEIGGFFAQAGEKTLTVTVGEGWMRTAMAPWCESSREAWKKPGAIIAELHLQYADGSHAAILTDESWEVSESALRLCDLYDGVIYDASFDGFAFRRAVVTTEYSKEVLIPDEGEPVREHERIAAVSVFRTPKGETVVDFGQNLAGYVSFCVDAHAGDRVRISHGEVLDREGNFYNANYRAAKAQLVYTCREGVQRYKPGLTYFGFRYLRLDEFPGEPCAEQFTAVAVYSDMERTGRITTGHALLNRLMSNILWSQRSNFIDVPTDCPQRDERRGWTGDAQVFLRAATYSYQVQRFYRKWLRDLAADQRENGAIPDVIPEVGDSSRALDRAPSSAAWGDAACICPWLLYLHYGDRDVLAEQFGSMKKWVDYITGVTARPGLWVSTSDELWSGGHHYGDWLGLDAPAGSYRGASREELIAGAFYYVSASLLVKAGEVLGVPLPEYRALSAQIRAAFLREYPEPKTQTECVVMLHFGLTDKPAQVGQTLVRLLHENGDRLTTGFVGTQYLLHALHRIGQDELAYDLLLSERFPSWLYSVKLGATTVWEHWDGVNEDGRFWDAGMNSFNHYAYGAVADWVYGVAAGIQPVEKRPGYAAVRIAPVPSPRLGWLEASLRTAHGVIRSAWRCEGTRCRYEIETPVPAELFVAGKRREVMPGSYVFFA